MVFIEQQDRTPQYGSLLTGIMPLCVFLCYVFPASSTLHLPPISPLWCPPYSLPFYNHSPSTLICHPSPQHTHTHTHALPFLPLPRPRPLALLPHPGLVLTNTHLFLCFLNRNTGRIEVPEGHEILIGVFTSDTSPTSWRYKARLLDYELPPREAEALGHILDEKPAVGGITTNNGGNGDNGDNGDNVGNTNGGDNNGDCRNTVTPVWHHSDLAVLAIVGRVDVQGQRWFHPGMATNVMMANIDDIEGDEGGMGSMSAPPPLLPLSPLNRQEESLSSVSVPLSRSVSAPPASSAAALRIASTNTAARNWRRRQSLTSSFMAWGRGWRRPWSTGPSSSQSPLSHAPLPPALSLSHDQRYMRMGRQIHVMGYPGRCQGTGPRLVVDTGKITGVDCVDSNSQRKMLLTHVPIHMGNSGGAAINAVGQLVGVPSQVSEWRA